MTNNILRFWERLASDDPLEPLFKAAPILMHTINAEGVIVKVSRFWADKLGYRVEDMIGRPSTDFLTPDSRKYAEDTVLPAFFRTGEMNNVHYDFIRKDGKIISAAMSAIAEYDTAGHYIRSLAILIDNSDIKRSEKQQHQKRRSEAIGALVGGVAHDFNNLLAVIQGNLEFLDENPDDPDRREFIANALQATKRAADVTQQLLTYGRRATLMPKAVNLNDVVMATEQRGRQLFPKNITIEVITDSAVWPTFVDAALLQTALLNILDNARDAMPAGGHITLETRNTAIDACELAPRQADLDPGPYVMLSISDTGAGMDSDVLDKIFEPYFTTKPVHEGTGLGLSMVYGFMNQSKGAIRVASTPGGGTTLRLYFKAMTDAARPTPSRIGPSVRRKEARLVLLVEDDDDVRRVLARQLEGEGVEVVQCSTGAEAYEHVCTGLVPDVLVTDIVMPGSLQGPELAARVRLRFPGLKVLYISGYPAQAAIHGSRVQGGDLHLIKPVRQDVFRNAVSEMLKPPEH